MVFPSGRKSVFPGESRKVHGGGVTIYSEGSTPKIVMSEGLPFGGRSVLLQGSQGRYTGVWLPYDRRSVLPKERRKMSRWSSRLVGGVCLMGGVQGELTSGRRSLLTEESKTVHGVVPSGQRSVPPGESKEVHQAVTI